MDIYKIVFNPVSTEKSMRMMEAENKLVFDVASDATKSSVKSAIEEMFNTKVEKVNTLVLKNGKKRAVVRFSPDKPAIDIATQLGIM